MYAASGLVAAIVTTCVIAVASAAPVTTPIDPRALPGWSTYDRYCLACHGARGDGRGPGAAYTRPRPRDFTLGDYEWRTTPIGDPPTDEDLRAAIRFGVPGTSMPAFDSVLSARELADTIMLIEAFSPSAFSRARGAELTLAPPPEASDPARGATLWTQLGCATCHGAGGQGDTPAHPFDLTTERVRRPRSTDDREARRRAIALDLATGLAGTAMPGYSNAATNTDLWALADHVLSLEPHAPRVRALGTLDANAITTDQRAQLAIGTRPGGGDVDEDALFGDAVAAQGAAPASLAPAEASLRARQCGRCHAKQVSEWTGSIHGAAASPGLRAQIDVMTDDAAASCRRCHTPLAEQRPAAGTAYDRELQAEGVTCAACHVRAWARRGPPNVAPSLLSLPGYPLQTLPIFERGDLCITCHQLPPRTAVGGRPLLNTYAEWLDGPYMRRGVQCQHCHMPNREHRLLGIHDRDTFRQGIELTASARRDAQGRVGVAAILRNIGAGHMLPTTTTPAVWLAIALVDGQGAELPLPRASSRIGRDLVYEHGAWRERSDTRIAPGDSALLVDGWSADRTAGAVAARVTVTVRPDDYYEGFYQRLLSARPPPAPAQRALYEQALARARASSYVAEERILPL